MSRGLNILQGANFYTFYVCMYVCMYIALVSAPYVVDAKPKFSCQIRGAESGIHYIQ